jgi:outer membrane protein assembly factor BamB
MSDAIQPGLPVGYSGGAIRAGEPRPAEEEVKPRIWPALIIVAIQWAALTIPARLAPGDNLVFYGFMFGTNFGMAGVLLWWLFASRVSWRDVGIVSLVIAVGLVTLSFVGHHSMNSFPLFAYVAPMVTTVMVVWLGVTPFLSWPWRRAGLILAIGAVCAYYGSMRLEGMTGSFHAIWRPRWKITDEDRFIEERAASLSKRGEPQGKDEDQTPLTAGDGDWPAFRGGVARDSINRDAAIETDWTAHPPKLLWKQRVGPGWSSFAVIGDRLFTQEQRSGDEAVVCYDAATGKEIWEHKDEARFYETIGGPGPRATPTFHEGKLYTQGATGILNCLDARTGKAIWSRNVATDSGSPVPMWGFAASPLVVDGIVTVYGGAENKAVLAYDAATGKKLWEAGNGDQSYCSTQLSRIDGVDQLLIATNKGAFALEPKTGALLWDHDWPSGGMARVAQPNVIGSDVLIGTGFLATRRLHLERQGTSWEATPVWTSPAFKPYFNDFVVHDGHIYGFDGPNFACIDLKNGKRKWLSRDYDSGQVLLLEKQGLLLILSEGGDKRMAEVALVEATAAKHNEIAKIPGIEGKTWNHPVVAHGRLFIRNSAEMACFELSPRLKLAQGK